MQSERSKHYSLPPRASPRLRSTSVMSPDTRLSSINSDLTIDSPFQMMDIVVSVDILEGLVMEMKDKHHSFDFYDSGSQSSRIIGTLPVTTFVSCKKKVSSTRTIATHVPSLPLSKPSSTHGGKHNHFLVRWPADYDPHGDALSTFKMSRLMKKESTVVNRGSFGVGYVPEEIELTIGLMRGSEMLTLGLANLVITGEETEEMIIDLPINITKDAVKDSKKTKRSPSPLRKLRSSTKMNSKILKPKAFPSDPKRRYRLSEQSMIRLQVKITPESKDSFSDELMGREQMNEETWTYEEPGMFEEFDSSPLTDTEVLEPEDFDDHYNSKAQMTEETQPRMFGKELPQFTSDYMCGPIDYRASIDNAYQLAKSSSYDLRRGGGEMSNNNASIRNNNNLSQVIHDEIPREMDKQIMRSNSRQRSSSGYRSESRHRAGSGGQERSMSQQRPRNRSSSQYEPVSQYKAGAQHRAGSRPRAASHLRERSMPEDEYYLDSQLYEQRFANNGSIPSRSGHYSVQNKSKSRDENRYSGAGSSWFVENNYPVHPQVSNLHNTTQSEFYPHPNIRTRPRSPTQHLYDKRLPPQRPDYNNAKYYAGTIDQQQHVSERQNQTFPTRSISSMR